MIRKHSAPPTREELERLAPCPGLVRLPDLRSSEGLI